MAKNLKVVIELTHNEKNTGPFLAVLDTFMAVARKMGFIGTAEVTTPKPRKPAAKKKAAPAA